MSLKDAVEYNLWGEATIPVEALRSTLEVLLDPPCEDDDLLNCRKLLHQEYLDDDDYWTAHRSGTFVDWYVRKLLAELEGL